MIREEKERAITTLRWLHDNAFLYFLHSTEEGIKFATEEGIKALEQEPCKYEDITTAFQFGMAMGFAKKYDEMDKVIEEVKKVVTPQPKTGHCLMKKMIDAIDFAIKATDSQDDYSMGMRNGMRYVKSLIDGKEPQFESERTDEEIKLGIDLGDEVVDDYGAKGVVVGIDTYEGEIWLSLLMRNHKVPQLVRASMYKTKTSRHFPQIVEVLEQIKGEADGK